MQDYPLRLALDIFPCVDGHAQERSLFDRVLATVQPGELWIGDRSTALPDVMRYSSSN